MKTGFPAMKTGSLQFSLKECGHREIMFSLQRFFCSVVAFDVEVESYILNLQTIGKKQLSFIHFFADITEFITFSSISKAIPYTIL